MGAAIAPIMIGTALIGAATSMAGASSNAQGAYNQYQAQSANAAYQAQVAKNNAIIAGRNANMDLQAGETAVVNRGLKTRAQIGSTLAGQGGSGVDVNSGSFAKARAGESEVGALDALTIRSNAAKQVYADETQQSNFAAEGGLQTQESQQAGAAAPTAYEGAMLTGFGSALSSASTVGGNYYKYLQTTG